MPAARHRDDLRHKLAARDEARGCSPAPPPRARGREGHVRAARARRAPAAGSATARADGPSRLTALAGCDASCWWDDDDAVGRAGAGCVATGQAVRPDARRYDTVA